MKDDRLKKFNDILFNTIAELMAMGMTRGEAIKEIQSWLRDGIKDRQIKKGE